ncbi:MAG: replicative DNA helicase [Alphaproteobacteria bacterium]
MEYKQSMSSSVSVQNVVNDQMENQTIVPLHPSQTQQSNIEAEQALLGALLLNNETFEQVSDFLKPNHFADATHGKIFEAIQYLLDHNKIADPITLKDYFKDDQELKSVGGAKYLIDLADSVISIMNAKDYGKIIYDLYLRRQLISIAQEMIQDARDFNFETSAITYIETAEQKLYDIATKGQNQTIIPLNQALSDAISKAEKAFKRETSVIGVTTGFRDIDRFLGGMHNSDLIVLAGRPSMGKTSLATNIAFQAARLFAKEKKEGANVAFFSLEMSGEQLATRILSSETKIPSDRIRKGDIRSKDFESFVNVNRNLQNIGLYIDDSPGLNVTSLRRRAKRLKRKYNIGLIVIDYLQLLEPPMRRNVDNRTQEVSEITRSLKALAKELDVPVLALSQLSRAVEQREDKRPQLSDLRESGAIEQDADVVLFVYREEYYEARKEPPPGTEKYEKWQKRMTEIYNKAEVIVAKQRNGPVGAVKLFFDSRFTNFGTLDTR